MRKGIISILSVIAGAAGAVAMGEKRDEKIKFWMMKYNSVIVEY